MTMHKHRMQLSRKALEQIHSLRRRGKHGARVITRARMLLLGHRGTSSAAMAAEREIHSSTVQDVRHRPRAGRLKRSLDDAPRPGHPPKRTAAAAASLVAIAWSALPDGPHHWTLARLQTRMIAANKVPAISTVAIWQHLHQRGIQPWRETHVGHADADACIDGPQGAYP